MGPGKGALSALFLWLSAFTGGCTKATYYGPPAPQPSSEPASEPFLLLSVEPPDGAQGVGEDIQVVLTFSRPPDPATVTASCVQLVDEETDQVVPCIVEPSSEPPEAVFHLVPTEPLRIPLHPYRIEIGECIAASDDTPLDLASSPVSLPSRFTTRSLPDTQPPEFFYFDLRAEPLSATAIHLSWFPALDGSGGSPPNRIMYRIYLGTAPDAVNFAEPAATTLPGQTEYTLGGLTPSTTYYFVVHAVDEAGNEDDNTITVSARTHLAAETTQLTILYTGDVVGTLEPCG